MRGTGIRILHTGGEYVNVPQRYVKAHEIFGKWEEKAIW